MAWLLSPNTQIISRINNKDYKDVNSDISFCFFLANANLLFADTYQDIEATTATGDKVILHPNGGWEYVDIKKAEVANAIASQHPENQICPKGAQRANFGYGRCILPGDKDYNRGSLGGKGKF